MNTNRNLTLRSLRFTALAGVIALSVLLTGGAAAAPSLSASGPKPTVVLVHGAFADASSWNGVVKRLQRDGYPVIAPANPLRGVSSDAAYISTFLQTVSGPIILVGHSYGGAVITNAPYNPDGTINKNVKALVYVAAYIPDVGETVGSLTPLPGSQIVPPGIPGVTPTLILRPWLPVPDPTTGHGFEGYIDPAKFHQIFAADLPAEKAAVMAATQRPAALEALGEPSPRAAWRSIRSFAVVATQDNAIGTANVRDMAQDAHAQIVEVAASHVVMISHPDAVEDLIRTAAESTN